MPVLAGEIVDAAVMRRAALDAFLAEQVADARERGVLFSVHLKATMMKVSDPILFGRAVTAYFADVFDRYGEDLASVGADPNDGLASVLTALEKLPAEKREAIEKAITATYDGGPALAMVDSDRGITNLHVPSDVIIDASMPAAIRSSGQMWNAAGELQDTKFVIPDSSYAPLYAETVAFCREHGAFDPTTMGTTPERRADGAEGRGVRQPRQDLRDRRARHRAGGRRAPAPTLLEHEVAEGDVWRACQTKDAPIRNWVELAVGRARATGAPAVFWLDETRGHDAQVLAKVRAQLAELDTDGLTIEILPVAEATRYTLDRARRGEDTISVTGNVLRDYLTDLFPILELGTSAKMLSIVPLMNGGGLFETGAGGSAPKHVQQLVKENHLRWDSLGEFLALAVSLEFLAEKTGNRAGRRARRGAGRGDRDAAGERQVAVAQGRRAGQPGQPLLPGPVLGAGAGRADRGRRAGRGVRAAGRAAGRRRGDDRRRAERRAGPAGRPGRLLLRGQGQGRRGDAPQPDLQRGAGQPLISRHAGSAPMAQRRPEYRH